ncbi:heavy metal translocating P-type ATPase [Altererythrobacter sp. Root672]|uniref:heavy metal translocating P-type ATPase n=1 Tax=Altererythrobacter sp. Root672 TaxID=1736584 RepID=UPI0006FC4422|nr:heavy metal translocating P-type ATPase [Altererythrobacter sp. Root672]KRA84482.1 nitrogen fixation protein FixI [Altererythrobacter sp. Root672]
MTAVALAHPSTGRTTLAVPGAHCAGCMSKIERGLAALPGVTGARVNLSARMVSVNHEAGLDRRGLVQALADLGFEAQARVDGPARADSAVRQFLAPLAVAGFAAMNVMLLSVSVWSGADGSTRDLFHWLSALIGVPAIAYAGQPFFRSAWGALRKGRTNMNVPISLGVLIATGLSLYETMVHGRHAWFDGALMLLTFLLAGRALDAMMRDRARAGVDALISQAPQGATVIGEDGTLTWQATDALRPGMVLRVVAGERLAADGEIVSGTSQFDQSLLTGESRPIAARAGDQVLAGTLNLTGPVDVRVSHTGHDTTLAEIVRLMEASTQNRSRYVRLADRASRLYAPAVHTLAALSVVGWLIGGASLYQALVIGVAVLIITCPCALGLAVPVAQVVSCGALMRAGIMVKDGSALERIALVDRALFDKTGTLTMSRPEPDPKVLASFDPVAASVALALASHSGHPLSRALAAALTAAGHRAAEIDTVEERPGDGVFARWLGLDVALRRPEAANGIAVSLHIEGRPPWLIPYDYHLRPDYAQALAELRDLGVEASIVSGDNVAAVAEVARMTGLSAQANASPGDKQALIGRLQAAGRRVLMVGDGLNDGPALAAADASLAPGSASDVGFQAADLVYTRDSLLSIPQAVRAARATTRVVKQNFALAIGYNVLAVPLAMAGLVTPLLAAVAMSTSSLVVIANSLRLVRAAR